MAAGLLIIPGWMPALDSDGEPISGALLWVYVNRTVTPVTVYSDLTLTTPLTNPVEADGSGQFPLIYADGAVAYSVAVTDADEAPLAAYDDVTPSTRQTDGIWIQVPVSGGWGPYDTRLMGQAGTIYEGVAVVESQGRASRHRLAMIGGISGTDDGDSFDLNLDGSGAAGASAAGVAGDPDAYGYLARFGINYTRPTGAPDTATFVPRLVEFAFVQTEPTTTSARGGAFTVGGTKAGEVTCFHNFQVKGRSVICAGRAVLEESGYPLNTDYGAIGGVRNIKNFSPGWNPVDSPEVASLVLAASDVATNFSALALRRTSNKNEGVDLRISHSNPTLYIGSVAAGVWSEKDAGVFAGSLTLGRTTDGYVCYAKNENAGFSGDLFFGDTTRAANSAFHLLRLRAAGVDMFRVCGDGVVYSPSTYSNTTASGANVFIGSDGQLYRSTSSARYKSKIKDYKPDPLLIDQLRPVTFSTKGGDQGQRFAGFIAEEVAEAGAEEFVVRGDDGKPDSLNYPQMVALCVAEIQRLRARVQNLEAA